MSKKRLFKKEVFLNSNPKSTFSESINSIKTNLRFSDLNGDKKVILITSSTPGEGKSFITANLAASFTANNKKVLIIDADLRKGRQNRIFRFKNDPLYGYSNMIVNVNSYDFDISDYIKKTTIPRLYVISRGQTPPSPLELLSSSNNRRLLNMLKEQFDYIFIDCPPVIVSDALVLSKYSDQNIVVVAQNITKIESLNEVKLMFEKANSKITGVILNKADKHSKKYGHYGYYSE